MKKHIRHGLIAAGLVITVVTAASVAGTRSPRAADFVPVATGDLGEVVVTAPRLEPTALVRQSDRTDERMLEIVVTARPLPRSADDGAANERAAFVVRVSDVGSGAAALC